MGQWYNGITAVSKTVNRGSIPCWPANINTNMFSILVLTALMFKHFLADFVFQTSWMTRDKAYYGKSGGLWHAGFHGFLTFCFLLIFKIPLFFCLLLGVFDSFLHYHIDYVKSNWIRKNSPTPNSQAYWTVHGIDQFLHFLTYVVIVVLLQ